jgi:hypothetical protein
MNVPTDINHPRILPGQWRAEAERLRELARQHPDMKAEDQIIEARAIALHEMAQQLENRLEWSGLS